MATYYVGIGGNDANSGLTWALRKLTLNGAEDVPVAAGDTVYVGHGVYRELLTCDVSGGAGNKIVYIGDVTGENTDGIGGEVRITGSDNDQAPVRANCIVASGKHYRTFRGFVIDLCTSSNAAVNTAGVTDFLIEDCILRHARVYFGDCATAADNIVRRCMFLGNNSYQVQFLKGSTVDNTNNLVENCYFTASTSRAIGIDRVGDITVRNCTFFGGCPSAAIRVSTALTVGQTIDIENCIFSNVSVALQAIVLGEIIEDFNTFWNNGTDRTNVAVGGNSLTYPPLFNAPILHSGAAQVSGYKFPWLYTELSEWSQIQAITGNNEPTEDLHGMVRPVTASKNSWGACQFFDVERDVGTVYDGVASLKLADAGRHQVVVPTNAVSTTLTCRVYREANYAGNNPQMIVKQPGQADDVTTDAGAASAWNELTTTLTPSGETDFVVVELVTRNTAAAGNYATYFDNLVVS